MDDQRIGAALRAIRTRKRWRQVDLARLAVSTWVVIADSRTNRRAVAAHGTVLRGKFPVDGRSVKGWLRDPIERIDALGFLPKRHVVTLGRTVVPVKGVAAQRPRTRVWDQD